MAAQTNRPDLVLAFAGTARPEALVQRLSALGVRLAVDSSALSGALLVLTSDRADRPPAQRPAERSDRPWIWLCPSAPSTAATQLAAAAGAVDVIDGSAPVAQVAARLAARADEHRRPLETPREAPELVTDSPAARRLLGELNHAARTSMPVLLTGETGTGKEVSARLLHAWSARHNRRFVPINCAAIPNEMLEAELFGYAKGAFSGAVQAYDGQLTSAEGGSVFLDEVDDTPLSFQVKILRVLEDRVVSRLGENIWRKVDFRIIAATNRDLRGLIARGLFGADLFERLAIVSIRLPPLRERREDLPALCRLLIGRFYREEPAARGRHQVGEVTAEAMALLAAYPWPGNIRELRNVLYGALVRKRGGAELLVSDLPPRLLRPARETAATPGQKLFEPEAIGFELERGTFNLRDTLAALEREALTQALARAGGNAAAAAELLGEVGRGEARDPGATVRAMMRRLGVTASARRGPRVR